MLRNLTPSAAGVGGRRRHVAATMKGCGRPPAPLCRLVADVLHNAAVLKAGEGTAANEGEDDTSCFVSLSDVRADLRQMLDFPDAFLCAAIHSRW